VNCCIDPHMQDSPKNYRGAVTASETLVAFGPFKKPCTEYKNGAQGQPNFCGCLR
jgi:hypothetical protein